MCFKTENDAIDQLLYHIVDTIEPTQGYTFLSFKHSRKTGLKSMAMK